MFEKQCLQVFPFHNGLLMQNFKVREQMINRYIIGWASE